MNEYYIEVMFGVIWLVLIDRGVDSSVIKTSIILDFIFKYIF